MKLFKCRRNVTAEVIVRVEGMPAETFRVVGRPLPNTLELRGEINGIDFVVEVEVDHV